MSEQNGKSSKITPETIITGAEFRDFYQNHWPKGYHHEDCEYTIETEVGEFILKDDARLKLKYCGFVCWSGDSRDARRGCFPFVDFYRAYAEKSTTTLLTAEIPDEKVEEFRRLVADLGGAIR